MAKTRCLSILLPDMWVTDYVKRRGRRIPFYMNVRTREKFYSKTEFYGHFRELAKAHCCFWREVWENRRTAEEEKDQICNRCKEKGHNCLSCPYPIIHKTNPYGGKRYQRCSSCRNVGHNIRSCDFPIQTYPKHLNPNNHPL